MKGTVKLYINPDKFSLFIEILSVLERLEFENSYTFDYVLVQSNFSEVQYSAWMEINIPIDTYLKLKYSCGK